MFCPECGIEDRQANQFCRSCGGDLRRVRVAVAGPDNITASAVSAREEIGRAIATKIREYQSANDLAVVAEEVLPEIEKFLESPEERRLRRMRAGMITACIGLGTSIGISIASMFMGDKDIMFLAALGLVCFFIGLSFILNGVFLTLPKKDRNIDGGSISGGDTDELVVPPTPKLFSSVTEHTTKHLKEKSGS